MSPLLELILLWFAKFRCLYRHLKSKGLGILITDHRVRETLEITDRAYVIHAGCILRSGTPQELVESPEVKKIYLGEEFTFNFNNHMEV